MRRVLLVKSLALNVLIVIVFVIQGFAQTEVINGSINGTVTSSDGEPAEVVNVSLKGTTKGSVTDNNGRFIIKAVEPGSYTIVASFTGLETKEQTIEVKSGETFNVDFKMSENSRDLKEVTITAAKSVNEKPVTIGKVQIKPIDLPQSVTVIEKELLEQQQTLHLSDAVKNMNGVYIMGTTGGYQEEIAGRGFAFSSSNTFKNGVRFNNTSMPEMSSLEKIEVMKGSTAILFGNVAAGGILNLITKKPQFEKGGEVSFRTGSYDLYKPTLDVYGAFNNSKHAAYRLNTSFEKARSFRDVVKDERFYINPSLLFKLGNKTDIVLEGDYLTDNRTADFGVGAIDYALIDVPRSRFLGIKWSYYKVEQQNLTSTITHHINANWMLNNVTSYQKFKSDLFANNRPNGNSQFIKPDGSWIRTIQRTEIDEEYYINQLDLTGKFNTGIIRHTFLFGADADKYLTKTLAYNGLNKYDTINVFNPEQYKQRTDIPSLTPRLLTTSPVNRVGVYVQDLVDITTKVKLLAGVRLSYLETFGEVYTYSNQTTTETKQFDKAITPRFGLIYQPVKTTSIFTSYSNSFTPNTGVDVSGSPLAPSFIDQYEVGVKNDFFKGFLSVNLIGYQIVNSNLAQTSLENGNTNANIKELAGEVTSQGFELDITSRPWKGFSVIAGYSFNDTKYTESNTYIVGSKLRYNPANTANLSVYYSLTKFEKLKGLNFGLSALYIGERVAGRSTRLTVPNDTYKLIPLDDYIQYDASIGYSKNNISLRVKLTNLLNTLSYNVHDDNSVNPIAPRQFGATVSYKF